ncbi:MAG TPA: EamA family transporter [Abditibacteriaceae bacterium]|jgi:transporter family protein
MWKYYALGSAVFAAATALLSKTGTRGVPSNLATAIRTLVVLVLAWGIVLVRGESGALRDIPRASLGWLILSGVATGASWLCYFRALSEGPVSVVAPLDKLSLPLAVVFGALLLGEKFSLQSALALGLIGTGTWLLVK